MRLRTYLLRGMRGSALILGLLGLGEVTLAEDSSHSTTNTGIAINKTSSTANAPCPTQLFDQIRAKDTQGGWLGLLSGIKASEACANHVRSYLDSPAELEKVLAGNSTLQLGNERPAGYLDACLADYTKRPSNCRGSNCNKTMTVEQQSAAVSDYYYLMNRLKMSSLSGLESIAGIDRILGTPIMKDVSPVSNRDIPSAGDAFSELQSNPYCRRKNPGELDLMAEQTRQALTILQQVQKKKKANQVATHKCVRNCKWKVRDPALQAQLESIEASLLRSFPWLQSENFAPIIKNLPRLEQSSPNKNPPLDYWPIDELKGKLKLHFTQTRKALVNHHNKIIEASRCIHGSGGNNCIRKHLDTFAATPELDVPALLTQNSMDARASGTWDRKTFSALAELSAGPCRLGVREAKRDVSDTMNDLVLNAGLTAVSFGASAYATAALKSAQMAQRAVNGGKAIQALSRASRLPRAAQLAVAVSIGADAAWLGPSGIEVLNQCTGEAEQKFGIDYREVSVGGKVSCSNDQAKQLAAVSESRNCVMAAALAAMDALPLVPPLAARFSKAKSSIIAAAPPVVAKKPNAALLAPKHTPPTTPLPTSSPDTLTAQVKHIDEMSPAQREAYAEADNTFTLDMMAESGSEYAVLATRHPSPEQGKDFFEHELKLKTSAPSSALPAANGAGPRASDSEGLTFLSKNTAWREGLPMDVRKKTEHRLAEFEKLRGKVIFAKGGSHFTLAPNGYPIIQLDSSLRDTPNKLGQTLAHELDHFMHYERQVRKASNDNPDPAIRALTRTRLPHPGEANMIGTLEDKAVKIEALIVQERVRQNQQLLDEINKSSSGQLLSPNRARIAQSIAQDLRYLGILDLYPDQEVLRRLSIDQRLDFNIRNRRMNSTMEKIVQKIFDARLRADPSKKLSEAEILQEFDRSFYYLAKKSNPDDLLSTRGLSEEGLTELRVLFFIQAAQKYKTQLDAAAITKLKEILQSDLRDSLAKTTRESMTQPVQVTDQSSRR